MAITNYKPTIWHAGLLENFHQNTFVIATLNRQYEGDIVNGGEAVKITGFTQPTIKAYSGSITREALTDSTQSLLINQKKYYAFLVDDVDKVQAAGSFDAVLGDVGAALADDAEDYALGQMLANGTSAGTAAVTTFALADAAVVSIRTGLVKAKVPNANRYLAVNPEAAAFLMNGAGSLFKANEAGSDATLRNGVIGSYRGFTVIETPSASLVSTTKPVFLGYHGPSVAFVNQLIKNRANPALDAMGDQLDGINVYGSKVLRATAVQHYISA